MFSYRTPSNKSSALSNISLQILRCVQLPCQSQYTKRTMHVRTLPRNGGHPRRPRRIPGVPDGRAAALALRATIDTPHEIGGMSALTSCPLSFSSRTCPSRSAPSLLVKTSSPRHDLTGAVHHPAARRVSSCQGSLREARGGVGGAWRHGGRVGARAVARRPSARRAQGGFSSIGQNEDEDKGVNRGGGHSAGRARGHGVATMGQGVHASA